ncbi:MAG: tRNA uracil 4-sulfurtransferase ThiI [Planctomycetota bacterium]
MFPAAPTHVLIHYGEIALKGGNRSFFEAKLARNIEKNLAGLLMGPVDRQYGRFVAPIAPGGWAKAREGLSRTFGISYFAPVYRVERDFEALKRAVADRVAGMTFPSFAVRARRPDKKFPVPSPVMERELGAVVWEQTKAKVDLENPACTVGVEALWDEILFYVERVEGPGGLPVGASGRVAALLSGGIDSPVAVHLMQKRGCRVVFVHFHSAPFTTAASREKVRDLVKILAGWQQRGRVYHVPFIDVQQSIVEKTPPPLRVILYRRFMARIAEKIALGEHAEALVTGENLGQVASQTLQNLGAIEAAVTMPVLRPLLGFDKQEIIVMARTIGTYETSIEPHQDCCSYLMPRNPATRSRPEELSGAEEALDTAGLVAGAVAKAELEVITAPGAVGEREDA